MSGPINWIIFYEENMDWGLQKLVVGHNNLAIRATYFIFCRRNKISDRGDFLRFFFFFCFFVCSFLLLLFCSVLFLADVFITTVYKFNIQSSFTV